MAALSFAVAVALGTLFAASAMGSEPEAGTYSTYWWHGSGWGPPTLQLERKKGQVMPEVVTMQNPRPQFPNFLKDCVWEDFKAVGPGEWEAQKKTCTPAQDPPLKANVEIDPSARWQIRGRIWSYAERKGGNSLINHWWSIRQKPIPAPPKPPAPVCTGDWRETGQQPNPMKFYMTDAGSLLDIRWDGLNFHSGAEIKLTGQKAGPIATYELIGAPASRGHQWIDFHVSGRHGDKLDQAYIRRNHTTLNPRDAVLPASC